MAVWIAFFRGINVGGNNPLPMKTLPALLEKCGCHDSRTYIQSGNVVFRSDERDRATLATRLAARVRKEQGFEPCVVLLTLQELEQALKRNPFPQAAEAPKALHLYFLEKLAPRAELQRLEDVKAEGDGFALLDQVFYLHTPGGIGVSKVAQRIERALGVNATARNWRTCTTVLEMARELAGAQPAAPKSASPASSSTKKRVPAKKKR